MDEATALVPLLSAAMQDKEHIHEEDELGEVGEDDTKWDQERERRMNIETNLAKLEELGLSPAVCTWRKRKRVQPLKPRVRAQHHPVRVSCNRGRSSEFTIKHHSKGRGMTQVGEEEEDEDDFRISNCGPAIYKREEYTKLDLAKLGSCKTEYPDLFFEKDYGGPTKEGCTICHQCRQKTKDQKTKCSLCSDRSMKGQFCAICLQIRYGENLNEVMDNPDWICPVCRDICNCSFCRMKKGWAPTGVLGPYAMKIKGYPSVAHYLIHSFQKDKLRAEETDEEEEDDDVSSSDNEDHKRDSDYADEKGEEEEEMKVEWEFKKEVEQERRAQKTVKDHHRRDNEDEEEEDEDEEEEVEDDGSDYVDDGDEDVEDDEEDEDEDDDEDEEGEDDSGGGRKRLRRSNRRVSTKAKNGGGQASGVVVPKKEEGGDEVDSKEGEADKEEKKDTKEEKEEKEENGVVVDDGGGGGDDDKDILPGEKDMKKAGKPPKKRQRTSSGQPPTTGSGSNKTKNAKKKNKKDKEATTTTTLSNNNNNHNKKAKKHEGKKSSDKAKEIKYNKGQLVCCWADPAYGDEQRFWIGKVRQTSYKHARKVSVQWFEKQPDGLYLLTSELDSIPAASIFRTNFEPKFVAISKRKWRLDEDLTPSGVDWNNYH